MGREGVWARSGPLASGGVRGSALTSSEGRNKQAKQPQTVEGERKRKGRGNVCWEFRVRRWNLLEVYWLQVVSVTLLPPLLRWEGRRKGRREAPSHQPAPSLCFFAQKEACTWVWKWNRARLVKRECSLLVFFILTVSCSRKPFCYPALEQITYTKFAIVFSLSPLLSPTAGGVSRLALDFLLCRATALEQAELKEEGGGGTTMVGGGCRSFSLSVRLFLKLVMLEEWQKSDDVKQMPERTWNCFLDNNFFLAPLEGGRLTTQGGTGTLCSVCGYPYFLSPNRTVWMSVTFRRKTSTSPRCVLVSVYA